MISDDVRYALFIVTDKPVDYVVTDAYQESWQSTYPLQISYLRSEMQVKFANITNSPNEMLTGTSMPCLVRIGTRTPLHGMRRSPVAM